MQATQGKQEEKDVNSVLCHEQTTSLLGSTYQQKEEHQLTENNHISGDKQQNIRQAGHFDLRPLDLVQEVEGEDRTLNIIPEPESRQTDNQGFADENKEGTLAPGLQTDESYRDAIRKQVNDSISSASELFDQSLTINMIGDHYYALLLGDRLLLFADQESGDRYSEQVKEEWDNRPLQTYVIYRHSHQGLLEENPQECSFTLLLQDNVSKMKQLKVKITIDTKSYLLSLPHQGLYDTNSEEKQEITKQKIIYQNYKAWTIAIKKTQRPIWVDPDIASCFICERDFSLVDR